MMMTIIIIAVNDRFVVFVQQVLFTLFRIGGLFGVLLYRLWRKISGSRVVGGGWGGGGRVQSQSNIDGRTLSLL